MIEILHNTTDITSLVISYSRTQEICSGTGTLDIVLSNEGRSYSVWDVIELSEDGTKKGEYFITETDDDKNTGTTLINAQDGSKKLTDYYVDEVYEVESDTYTRPLITMYLDLAGVSYSFTAGNGVLIGAGASFGMGSAYENIMTLLQYSGWYMYFNSVNTCIIGKLAVNPSGAEEITDATILYIKKHKNDDMLRNKAVVWGGSAYPEGGMVGVSKQVHTPWNYDRNDLRAVVISNGNIRDYPSANLMANKLIQEFARITIEKVINIAGPTTLSIGDYVSIDSKWWRGSGLITTNAASFSANDGFLTNIVLDQRCPRLFGFWKKYPDPEDPTDFDYIYVGTNGAGVRRKQISDIIWSNYSEGLENLSIIDLFVKDGTVVCVAEDGYLYIRTEKELSWTKYSHGNLIGTGEASYLEEDIQAVACSINSEGVVICGYNSSPDAWVIGINNEGNQVFVDQVQYTPLGGGDLVTDVTIFDLEAYNSNTNVITTAGSLQAEGYRARQSTRMTAYPTSTSTGTFTIGDDSNIVSTLGEGGLYDYREEDIDPESVTFPSGITPLIDKFGSNYMFAFSIADAWCTCSKINLSTLDVETHTFLYPPEILGYPALGGGVNAVYQRDENSFAIITSGYDSPYSLIYGFEYTFGETVHPTAYLMGRLTGGSVIDYTLLGNTVLIRHDGEWDEETQTPPHMAAMSRLWTYNLDSFSAFAYVFNSISETSSIDGNDSQYWQELLYGTPMTAMMPGPNSATFTTLWTKLWQWHWTPPPPYQYFFQDAIKIVHQSFVVTKDSDSENVTIFMGGEIIDEYYTKENDRRIDETINRAGLTAGGGCMMQFDIVDREDDTPSGIEYAHRIYSFNQDGIRVGRMATYKGVEWGTAWTDIYAGTYYHFGVSGKFYEPIWLSLYTEGTDKYIIFRNLTNATYRVKCYPNYITTTLGTEAEVGSLSFAYVFDDNDRTIYVRGKDRTFASVNALFGFSLVGGEWKITKEFITGHTYTSPSLLREFVIVLVSGTTYRLIKGFPVGPPSNTLAHVIGESFEAIHEPGGNPTVEISKGSPIEVYHKAGVFATDSAFLYQNSFPTISGWSEIESAIPIHDLRVFDIIDPTTFTIASGYIGDELRWVGVATTTNLKAFPTSLSGDPITIAEFDGTVTHFETTNYNENPYLFVAISGSGAGFWQRSQDGAEFEEYSLGLPSEHVTIIRADDRI